MSATGEVVLADPEVNNVVDYLQRTGDRYKEHLELLRRQRQEAELSACSFKPVVTKYAEKASRESVLRQNEAIEDRLYQLHARKAERLEELRGLQSRLELEKEKALPFKPQLTAKAAALSRSGPLCETMERWAEERDARRAQLQEEALRRETAELSGAPRISAYAQTKARLERPADLPVEEYMRLQDEAARQRKYALVERSHSVLPGRPGEETEDGAKGGGSSSFIGTRRAFSPNISVYASRMELQEGVVERLYQPTARGDASRCYDPELALHCTFRPTISAASRELSAVYYHQDPSLASCGVHERLYRSPRHASHRHQACTDEGCTFAPQISETSKLIVETKRVTEEPLSPASRLHQGGRNGSSNSRAKERERGAETEEDASFQPSISKVSEDLWNRQLDVLARSGVPRTEARAAYWRQVSERKAEALERERRQLEARQLEECTFRPKAGRPPRRAPGEPRMAVEDRVLLWDRQRQRRIERLREEVEAEAEAENTFQPEIEPDFPLPRRRGKAIHGAGSFLERQRKAQLRREELKEWWRPKYARQRAASADNSRRTQQAPATDAYSEVSDEEEPVFVVNQPPPRSAYPAHPERQMSRTFSSNNGQPRNQHQHQQPQRPRRGDDRSGRYSPYYMDRRETLRERPPAESPVGFMTALNRSRF